MKATIRGWLQPVARPRQMATAEHSSFPAPLGQQNWWFNGISMKH